MTDDISTVTLKVKVGEDGIIEREMVADGDYWSHQWTEQDFLDLPVSSTPYDYEVLVEFTDTSQATFPTSGVGKILVMDTLPSELIPETAPENGQVRVKNGITLQMFVESTGFWHTLRAIMVPGLDEDGVPVVGGVPAVQLDQTGE